MLTLFNAQNGMCPSSLKFQNYTFSAYNVNLRSLSDTCQLLYLTQYPTSQADKTESVHLLTYLITYKECMIAVYCIISLIIHKNWKVALLAFLLHHFNTSS